MAMEVVVARTNREVTELLARRLLDRAKTNPFARQMVLVDSHAIGRNVVAQVAAHCGFAFGVEPVVLEPFLRDLVAAITAAGASPLPASRQPLSQHAIALAMESVIAELQTRGSRQTKEIANAIAAQTCTTAKFSLLSELARSYDAVRSTHLPSAAGAIEPWVRDLHDVLVRFSQTGSDQLPDRRLLEYLEFWPTTLNALQRLADDATLRGTLQERRLLPNQLFVFDPTVEENSPASKALSLIARSLTVELFLVDPVIRDAVVPACRGWAGRSRAPILSTKKVIGESPCRVHDWFFDGTHSLRTLQKAVAGIDVPDAAPMPDTSLAIHYVVSDARAAEVVRDVIHRAFVDIPDLIPEDVAVVTDDPRAIEPYIEAAFAMRDPVLDVPLKDEEIPVVVVGANTRDKNPAIDAFISAMRLAPTSFAQDAVFRVVAMQPVLEGLGLERDDLETLEMACAQAGLRAYIDRQHREDVIQVGGQTDDCTWVAALNSLAAAMAVPDGGHSVVTAAGLTPAGGLQTTDMPALAALRRIIEILGLLRKLTHDAPLHEKVEQTTRIAQLLLGTSKQGKAGLETIQRATTAISADATSTGFGGVIDFFWFAGELSRRLNRSDSGTCALYGGVSVLKPAQARGRTPRVAVFMLSERFPTQDRPLWPEAYLPGTEVLEQQQIDLRDMFSIFMNTVDRVVFVVPSMCERTGERLSMSSIVHDINTIAQSLAGQGVVFTEHEASVVSHALSATDSPAVTRHRGSRAGVAALRKARMAGYRPQIFPVPDLAHPVPNEVSLESFLYFFEKPIQAYFQHRRLYLDEIEDDWQSRESLKPSFLDQWRIRDAIFKACSAAGRPVGAPDLQSSGAIIARLRAAGVLRSDGAAVDQVLDRSVTPHGLQALAGEVAAIHSAWASVASGVPTPVDVPVSYEIKDAEGATRRFVLRIRGSLFVCTTNGKAEVVRYSIRSRKAGDTLALAALQAVCAAGSLPTAIQRIDRGPGSSKDVPAFETRLLSHAGAPPPLSLEQLVRIWHLGLQMPIPLFADAMMAALPKTGAVGAANPVDLNKANKKFLEPYRGVIPGEGHDGKVKSVFRGCDAIRYSLFPVHDGPESDFKRLAEFFGRAITDAFPAV